MAEIIRFMCDKAKVNVADIISQKTSEGYKLIKHDFETIPNYDCLVFEKPTHE